MGFDLGDLARLGKKVVKNGGAPLIGTILGGPAGGAIGGVINNLLGVSSPAEAEALLEKDPMAWEKLKEYEMNNKLELQKLEIQNEQMYLSDVQSARGRETEIVKTTGKKDIFMYVLAGSLFYGFFVLIGILLFIKIPVENANMLMLYGSLFGTLSSGFIAVVSYFFGSSKGSSEKDKIINNVTKNGKG